jgi:hypothetical protein
MGFFDDVLSAIGKVFNVVMYAAGTLTAIAAAGLVEFAQIAYERSTASFAPGTGR